MRTLRACLLDEPLPRLMAMADLWDAPVEATSPKAVVDSLAAHFLNTSNLFRERDGLPSEARAALDAVLAGNGRLPLAAFERRFGNIRPMGPGKLERERPWLMPANAAEVLWYRGFIFRAFDNRGVNRGSPVEMAFVPTDVLDILQAEVRPAADEPLTAHAPLPTGTTFDAQPSLLLDDVVTLLCHIQNGDVKVKNSGEWDAPSRRALAPMLRDASGVLDSPPNGRFGFLVHLVERLGFTRVADGRLRLIPQPVAQWLQSPPAAQRDALFQAWLNDDAWNDLAHVPGLSLQMTHVWSNDAVRERSQIVEMWQQWELKNDSQFAIVDFGLGEFVAHVKATNPDFARPDGRYDTWHVRDEASGDFLHGFENWDKVEGALIRHVIEQPLTWLTPQTSASSPSPAQFTVTGSGRVSIPAWLRFERFQLARIADWVSSSADSYTHQLTPRALNRAKEQGIRLPRVIEFLEQTAGKPLADGLKSALARWGERGIEARAEPMMILKTQDASIMESVLKLPEVRRAVVDRFAPNCISIRPRDADTVRNAIIESGLMVDWT